MSPILDIAYVRYQVTDLDRLAPFLQDFGLQAVARTGHALYSRWAGPAHHVHIAELGPVNATLGFGLLARSAADLAELARRVQRPVEDNPEPGGGQRVRFTDPAGFLVDVIHGQVQHTPLPMREPIPANPATGRRRLGQPIRLAPAASTVRLGMPGTAWAVSRLPRSDNMPDRPGLRPSLNRACWLRSGLERRSASISRVRWPCCANTMARLAAAQDESIACAQNVL